MAGHTDVIRQIGNSGVVAVLRGIDEERIAATARAMYEAGVGAIEVTADGTRTREKIAAVDRELAETDAVVGAGTVLDEATTEAVVDAGATFVLAPDCNPTVIQTCNRHGVAAIPGVMTPAEAVAAIETGADILKMFPAATVGPEHIGALQGPLGDVRVMPTGGVTTENIEPFFDAGAFAIGAGSAIVNYDAVEDGEMDRVRETAAAFVDAVESARLH